MRIAFHVPRASYLAPGSSGDKTNVQNLVRGLTDAGHEIRIVSRLNVRDLWRGRIPAWRIATEAVRVRREMKAFSPQAWLVYGASATDPDLLGWWQCRGRYVLIQARAGRGRRLSARWRRPFRTVHRRSLARADAVVAERPAARDDLRRLGVPDSRLLVLPSPVGGLGRVPSQAEARNRLSLPLDVAIVLCVTRLPPLGWGAGKTEGVLDLLACAARLPENAMVVIVGDGEGRTRIEDEVIRLGITERVRLIGSVPHDEVRWFYAASDLYAYPFAPDLPFVAILEAQAAGRPVVVMRSRSTETIVADGRTGVLADDLEGFASDLADLAADRARCAGMGEAAGVYAGTHHSVETRVGEIEALLSGARNEAPRAARTRRSIGSGLARIATNLPIRRSWRHVRRRGRRLWERYLKWPAPLWRLRGQAQLRLDGHEFTFHVQDENISWADKVRRGKWERRVTAFLTGALQSGDVFFDVGAWTGPYSLLAARLVEPAGWVYAFEPDPVARRLLERNVATNGVRNVTVLPYGVTDQAGAAWLNSPRLGGSQSTVDPGAGVVQVPTVTLEGFCEHHGIYPQVIKIDVEGGEAQVVAGASTVLRRARAIALELHEPHLRARGIDPGEFRRSLDDLGKEIVVLQDRADAGVVNLGLLRESG